MKLLRAMLFALLMPLCAAHAAHAALVSADSPLGSGSGVVDTNTAWEWLQLSATRRLTISQVLAATSPSGILSDFHYATRTELSTLTNAYLWFGCTSGCSTSECVFHGNWTLKPPQTGHAVQRKLDTHSTSNWTLRA